MKSKNNILHVIMLLHICIIILFITSCTYKKSNSLLLVTGTVEGTEVDVSSKIGGRIVKLAVNDGSEVKQNDILAYLDDTEQRASVKRERAIVNAQEGLLKDLLSGARKEEIEEARASLNLAQAHYNDLLAGPRKEELKQALALADSAKATRRKTYQDFNRIKLLHQDGLVSFQELDKAKEAYDVSSARESQALESYKLIKRGARKDQLDMAKAEIKGTQDRLNLLLAGPRRDQIKVSEAKIREAKAGLDLAEEYLKETVVLSPMNGVVLHKNKEQGEIAPAGSSILTLINPLDMWVRAYISEKDIGKIKIGIPAVIKVDTFKDRAFKGKVIEISSQAEFTPKNVQTQKERVNLVFRVKIQIDNQDGILKPGIPADIEFTL